MISSPYYRLKGRCLSVAYSIFSRLTYGYYRDSDSDIFFHYASSGKEHILAVLRSQLRSSLETLTIKSWSCSVRIIPAAVMCSHLHTSKISDGSSDFFSLFFAISRKLGVLHIEGSLLLRYIFLQSQNTVSSLQNYPFGIVEWNAL